MNRDKARSAAQSAEGTQSVRLVRIHHQTVAVKRTAKIFNPKMSRMRAAIDKIAVGAKVEGERIAEVLNRIHIKIAMLAAKVTHRTRTVPRELSSFRASQKINASETHAVPSTAGNVQPDTSNMVHKGPHFLSRHTCKAVKGSNAAPINTAIHTHRHA